MSGSIDWSVNVRQAERAVPVCRDRNGYWTIRHGDESLHLTEFEVRHLVRRIKDVLNDDYKEAFHYKRGAA